MREVAYAPTEQRRRTSFSRNKERGESPAFGRLKSLLCVRFGILTSCVIHPSREGWLCRFDARETKKTTFKKLLSRLASAFRFFILFFLTFKRRCPADHLGRTLSRRSRGKKTERAQKNASFCHKISSKKKTKNNKRKLPPRLPRHSSRGSRRPSSVVERARVANRYTRKERTPGRGFSAYKPFFLFLSFVGKEKESGGRVKESARVCWFSRVRRECARARGNNKKLGKRQREVEEEDEAYAVQVPLGGVGGSVRRRGPCARCVVSPSPQSHRVCHFR